MTDRETIERRFWPPVLIFSLAFFACAEAGRLLSAPGTSYVSFWLPAGLYVGVLLLYPPRCWPRFMIAALLANLVFDLRHGTSLGVCFGFYLANTVEAAAGAWIVRRLIAAKPQLATLRDLFSVFVGSATLSTTLGATLGAITLTASGMSRSFAYSWRTWWCSEAMAIMLMTPFVLVWFAKRGVAKIRFRWGIKPFEAAMLASAIAGFTWYMLVKDQGINASYKLYVLPLLLWAGLRFGLRGVTAANLQLAILTGYFTSHYLKGLTPDQIASGEYILSMQAFLMVSVVMSLVPAVIIEERNQKVVALKESEEKFSKAFESNPCAIGIAERSTARFIKVNENFCRLYGLSTEEVIGHTSLELGLWSDPVERDAALKQLLQTGAVRNLELARRVKNQAVKYILFNADTVNLGGKDCIVSSFSDITERKEAEAALRLSEERFRSAMENSPIGMGLVSPEGRWLDANPALTKILGYSRTELLALDFQSLTHPGDLEGNLQFVRRMLNRELDNYEVEKRYLHKDGHIVWAQSNVSLIWNPDGTPRHFVSQVQNITTRKQSEQALRHSEQLIRKQYLELENYYRTTPVGLCVINRELRYLRINERLANINGHPVENHIGRTIFEMVPGTAPLTAPIYRRVFETGEPSLDVEFRAATPAKPNEERDWLVSYYPLKDGDGFTYGVCGMVLDITDRKRAEQQQRKLEEQLRQAQKMEALGTLAGGTAHEFNNILGIMVGYTEFIKSELHAQHPLQGDLDEIMKAGQRAKEIVQQVLTFSRQQRQDRLIIHLHAVVADAVTHVRKTLPRSVEIRSHLGAEGVAILGNATQIHQMVMNICINAWHAMEHDAGIITLAQNTVTLGDDAPAIHSSLHPGPYLKLSISDNGKGMDSATLARIFEPFFTTKAPGKGSGLGLAVVHGIMQSHEGAVVASSEPGQGAQFDLYFPARPEPVVTPPNTRKAPACHGKGQRILLVDDEPSLIQVTTKFLQRSGYQTTGISSASEALDFLRREPQKVDLVISDLTMPGLNGIGLAKELQIISPGLPIILVSGFNGDYATEIKDTPNIRSMLQKPFTPEALVKTVQMVLSA